MHMHDGPRVCDYPTEAAITACMRLGLNVLLVKRDAAQLRIAESARAKDDSPRLL